MTSAARPAPDRVLVDIANYVCEYEIGSALAYETAFYCLMDTLACGFQALKYPACTKLMGPVVRGATMAGGARVPGTSYELEPVQAAFNIGTMIRWLDFNDTWLAAEWGHPSDNLGGILATADYLSRTAISQARPPFTVRDVLTAMIKAHEIQGVIALENSFNQVGLDHVILVRIASTAVVTKIAGRHQGAGGQRAVECMAGWRGIASVSTRAEHGFAQELGGRRCDEPRRAAWIARPARRNGLPVGAECQQLGLLRRAVWRQGVSLLAAVCELRHGKRPLQDFIPRRISWPDRR
jgi:hypothetical protein